MSVTLERGRALEQAGASEPAGRASELIELAWEPAERGLGTSWEGYGASWEGHGARWEGLGASVGEAKSQLGGPQSQISGLEDEERKKEKMEYFPICAYGHRPLRGRCPKQVFNEVHGGLAKRTDRSTDRQTILQRREITSSK